MGISVIDKLRTNLGLTDKDTVCINCNYLHWAVGIGVGIRCQHTKKIIPDLSETCDKFEFKINASMVEDRHGYSEDCCQ
jgi:hypothetical protein